ncbi:MAG: mechanosensitive ion channel family protein [Candidatus Omnitrophica bacterium]|nr:mechanosensitive ion channel family protein [Candidatus Omnitrophota bacterium]
MFFGLKIFGNTLKQYLFFLFTFLASLIILSILKIFILRYLKQIIKKTKTEIDDFLIELFEKLGLPLLYYIVFYLSINFLTLNNWVKKFINAVGLIFLVTQGIRFLVAILGYFIEKQWLKKGKLNEATKQNLKTILSIAKVILWGVGIIFILDNLGFKISTVLAGLGIGGVAIALAAQAILADLFSYFVIFFDKPFEVGDFIVIGEFAGTIEQIGIKTTRLRSLSGEQLIFSNTDLTNSRVRNYKRMDRRRVVFKICVTYQTPEDKLKQIPQIIKNIIENTKDTLFDRTHFSAFGDFSLIFEVVYFVLSPDYKKYMDVQEEINLAIKRNFEKLGIEFAYPTQKLYINKTD